MPAFLFVKYEIIILKNNSFNSSNSWFKIYNEWISIVPSYFFITKFVAFFIETQFFVCLYQRFTYGVLPWLPV